MEKLKSQVPSYSRISIVKLEDGVHFKYKMNPEDSINGYLRHQEIFNIILESIQFSSEIFRFKFNISTLLMTSGIKVPYSSLISIITTIRTRKSKNILSIAFEVYDKDNEKLGLLYQLPIELLNIELN